MISVYLLSEGWIRQWSHSKKRTHGSKVTWDNENWATEGSKVFLTKTHLKFKYKNVFKSVLVIPVMHLC